MTENTASRRYWFDGDVVKSHFFSAASMTFPGTEPFVVEAVKYYRDSISDEFLMREVDRLIFEEIGHSEIHGNFNHALGKFGYNVNVIQKMVVWGMKVLWKISSHKTRLAFAVGIEHYSTVLAKTVLEHDMMHSADKDVRDLWYWHTYEEVRHRSVSFDVYESVGGGRLRRSFCFIFIYLYIGLMTLFANLYLLAKDRQLFNVRFFIESHRYLWGRKGFLVICLPALLAFFKKGYHPKQWTMDISDQVHNDVGNYDVLIAHFPTRESYPPGYVHPYA